MLVIHRIATLMFKNLKEMVLIAVRMLFARNDQYHNYNIRQSRLLHPSVEGVKRYTGFLISLCEYMELSVKTYSS